MPTEFFVRHRSEPDDLQRRARPIPTSFDAGAVAHAGVMTSSNSSQQMNNSSVALPELEGQTSWRTSNGNWIHRSSSAPYEKELKLERQRLPKVLLTRVGAWRPSNAAGKGSAPATMPELLNHMKPHFRPGHGAEEELDKRLCKIKEIFAGSSPRKVKEWRLSPRLEEISKPRMVRGPAGLAFRECAPPPEALIKKKRRPMHIPMSPKERMAASGSAPNLGHSSSDLLADLDSRLNRMLGHYDSSSPPKSSESSKPKAKAKASAPVAAKAKASAPVAAQTNTKPSAGRAHSFDTQGSTQIEEQRRSGDSNTVGIVSESYEDDTLENSSAAGPDRTYSGTYSAEEFASMSESKLNQSDDFYSDDEGFDGE